MKIAIIRVFSFQAVAQKDVPGQTNGLRVFRELAICTKEDVVVRIDLYMEQQMKFLSAEFNHQGLRTRRTGGYVRLLLVSHLSHFMLHQTQFDDMISIG